MHLYDKAERLFLSLEDDALAYVGCKVAVPTRMAVGSSVVDSPTMAETI